MKHGFRAFVLVCALILSVGCASTQPDTITQYSFIDAILAGAYDGQAECSAILKHGDLGIGTFDGLDGEMVVLDREIYKVKYDGSIVPPEPGETTPFACVTEFLPDKAVNIAPGTDLKGLMHVTDLTVPNQNIFLALRAKGKFSMVLTRSVPKQTKPYPPLVEVTKNQSQFHLENVSGTLVDSARLLMPRALAFPDTTCIFFLTTKKAAAMCWTWPLNRAPWKSTCATGLCLSTPKTSPAWKTWTLQGPHPRTGKGRAKKIDWRNSLRVGRMPQPLR